MSHAPKARLLTLLLPLMAGAPLLAGAGSPSSTAGTELATEESAALARGLASFNADHIKADIHFIASDELRGRDTPSPEQRIAARFIAARLQRLGWQPGAEQGYFSEYSLPIVGIDGARTGLAAVSGEASAELQFGSDYAFFPSSISDYEAVAQELVFAGTMSDEDAEGLDLKDRWVLVQSSGAGYGKLTRAARKAGAVGVIMLPGEELDDEAMTQRVADWGAKAREGKLQRGRMRQAFPMLYMTSAGARKLYGLAGASTAKLGDVFPVQLTEKRASLEDAKAGLENVCGLWPGSDPELRNEVLIVSAHYDHVGVNDDGEVFNGADDNGSGTTGLLAIAEALAEYGPMRRSVLLIWVSGEEKGLLGSEAWTKNPWLPEGMKPVSDINIDMIGRNAPDYLLITPTSERPEYNGLVRMAEAAAPLEGFPELGSCDEYWSRSDHANFSQNLGVPVTFLFSDVHEDYHKPTDTPDKIDYDKIRRVGRLVLRMLDGLQGDVLDL